MVEDDGSCCRGESRRSGRNPPLDKASYRGTHIRSQISLIKDHNKRNMVDSIRLDFEVEDTEARDDRIVKGKEVVDNDLKNPFKEAVRTLLTRRIIEFAGLDHKMPSNIKLYDGTADPENHLSRFTSAANSEEWPMPVWCMMFQ
ncbi:hypothetical protein Tco_0115816 [Tanacetum coccineum]